MAQKSPGTDPGTTRLCAFRGLSMRGCAARSLLGISHPSGT